MAAFQPDNGARRVGDSRLSGNGLRDRNSQLARGGERPDVARPSGRKKSLTPREEAILFLLANGYRANEIAALFRVGKATIGTYIEHIRWWLRAKTSYEAVAHFKLELYGTPRWEQLTRRWQHLLSRRNSLRPVRLGLYPRVYLCAVKLPGRKKKYAASPLSAQAAKSSIECFTRRVSSAPSASSPTSASTGHQKIR